MEVRAIGSATRHIAKAGLVDREVHRGGEERLTQEKKLRCWKAVVGRSE